MAKAATARQSTFPWKQYPRRRRCHEDQQVLDPLAGPGQPYQGHGQGLAGVRRSVSRWGIWSVHSFGRSAQGVLSDGRLPWAPVGKYHVRGARGQRWDRARPGVPVVPGPGRGRVVGRPMIPSAGQRLVSASVKRPYRVVVAKPGLDGHDRGAKVIARALRDAGFEVIYTGLHQTAEQVVQAVVQEDADAVGLSLLSGAHLTLVPRVMEGLKEQGRGDVLVLVGGIIPTADIPVLKEMGVAEVFTPGPPSRPSATWLGEALDERETEDEGDAARWPDPTGRRPRPMARAHAPPHGSVRRPGRTWPPSPAPSGTEAQVRQAVREQHARNHSQSVETSTRRAGREERIRWISSNTRASSTSPGSAYRSPRAGSPTPWSRPWPRRRSRRLPGRRQGPGEGGWPGQGRRRQARRHVDEVRLHAGNILGLDIKGHVVKRLWVEHASDIAKEYYASFTLDRAPRSTSACCRPRAAWRSRRWR